MRYILIAFLLAGCATPEQRAEQAMTKHGPYCDRLGFQRDTDRWRECVSAQDAKLLALMPRPAPAPRQMTCLPVGGGAVSCF